MDFGQIRILYGHEVRAALRERSIVVASILVPLVMYPALLWALFAAMMFVEGQSERLSSRVVLHGSLGVHAPLADSLDASRAIDLRWIESAGDSAVIRDDLEAGRVDLLARLDTPESDAAAIPGNFRLVLSYDESRGRSVSAKDRVSSVVSDYRRGWIDGARQELGIPDAQWADYAVIRTDMATPDEVSRFILALLVPMLTLITVALAAFYPAIDATAGERERRTWETTLTTAASRSSIATAKYLYVATFGAVGGLLNLFALVLTLRWILPEGPAGTELAPGSLPLGALPAIGIGVALLGLFVAAGMLVFAVFARSFKEGQSMLMPFYLVVLSPAFFVQSPDIELTVATAMIPVANVALLVREAILGSIPPLPGAIALGVMGTCVLASVAFAQWILRREEVLLGNGAGGLWGFLRRRLVGERSA